MCRNWTVQKLDYGTEIGRYRNWITVQKLDYGTEIGRYRNWKNFKNGTCMNIPDDSEKSKILNILHFLILF